MPEKRAPAHGEQWLKGLVCASPWCIKVEGRKLQYGDTHPNIIPKNSVKWGYKVRQVTSQDNFTELY